MFTEVTDIVWNTSGDPTGMTLKIFIWSWTSKDLRLSNSQLDVVLRLCQPTHQTVRNVTADNWFTSVPLIDWLWSKNFSYFGTLKKNKIIIPPKFLSNKTSTVNSCLFAFTKECTTISCDPNKRKYVISASRIKGDNPIDRDTGDKKSFLPLLFTMVPQVE